MAAGIYWYGSPAILPPVATPPGCERETLLHLADVEMATTADSTDYCWKALCVLGYSKTTVCSRHERRRSETMIPANNPPCTAICLSSGESFTTYFDRTCTDFTKDVSQ